MTNLDEMPIIHNERDRNRACRDFNPNEKDILRLGFLAIIRLQDHGSFAGKPTLTAKAVEKLTKWIPHPAVQAAARAALFDSIGHGVVPGGHAKRVAEAALDVASRLAIAEIEGQREIALA